MSFANTQISVSIDKQDDDVYMNIELLHKKNILYTFIFLILGIGLILGHLPTLGWISIYTCLYFMMRIQVIVSGKLDNEQQLELLDILVETVKNIKTSDESIKRESDTGGSDKPEDVELSSPLRSEHSESDSETSVRSTKE